MSDARDRLAERVGIIQSFLDQTGTRHALSPESRDALLSAMDLGHDPEAELAALDAEDARRPLPLWSVVSTEGAIELPALEGHEWMIDFDGAGIRHGLGERVGDLPLGIHRLSGDDWFAWILAAPPALPMPDKSWGLTLPLYGLGQDGAIGSYDDLVEAAGSVARTGAGFVGINPIHAGFPLDPEAVSPYSPSHRGRLSTLHLRPDVPPLPPGGELVNYAVDGPARRAALAEDWAKTDGGGSDFRDWRAEQGQDLERFALHQALSDRFGPYWSNWPAPYRDPDGSATAEMAETLADAVSYHAWLQFRANAALARVRARAEAGGMRHGLYLDLAVGTHPHGAETWGDRDLFASGVSLGAPPDAFSASGQSWGLAPLRPDTLARRGFRPLAAILRRQLNHAHLLRIDHILGFERAFWVPDAPGIGGAYVTMPREALLAVARIEAARAGATIIGEDLGNIPDGLQMALSKSGILGCRVAQFQQDWDAPEATFLAPDSYDAETLSSFGTHDLPTWEGWKRGRDIDWRHDLGDLDDAGATRERARRKEEVAALTRLVGGKSVRDLHAFLAGTPACLIAVQIEDILGFVEQPNLPGTVDQHPNWRRALGLRPEDLDQLDELRATARLMKDAGRKD